LTDRALDQDRSLADHDVQEDAAQDDHDRPNHQVDEQHHRHGRRSPAPASCVRWIGQSGDDGRHAGGEDLHHDPLQLETEHHEGDHRKQEGAATEERPRQGELIHQIPQSR
jgi:hypothetical protein